MKANHRQSLRQAPAALIANPGTRVDPPLSFHDNLLLIEIQSHTFSNTSLTIPFSLVWQREQEMRSAVDALQIPRDRWNGSLLYLRCCVQQQSHVMLNPERVCAEQNYSQLMAWHPWLTTLLERYYHTGRLTVPTNCLGYDFLLALEFFGIVYRPQQLVCKSLASYNCIQAWSEYFLYRTIAAEWVARDGLDEAPQILRHVFGTTSATTPARSEAVQWGDIVLPTLLENVSDVVTPQQALGAFFNNETDMAMAEAMREDFALYLQNILTNAQVTFLIQSVTVTSARRAQLKSRAILIVDAVQSSPPVPKSRFQYKKIVIDQNDWKRPCPSVRTESDLSCPYDEIAHEHAGEIERERTLETAQQSINRGSGSPRHVMENVYDRVYEDLADTVPATPVFIMADSNASNSKSALPTKLLSRNGSAPMGTIKVVRNCRSATKLGMSSSSGPFFVDGSGKLREVHDDNGQRSLSGIPNTGLLEKELEFPASETNDADQRSKDETKETTSKSSFDNWDWLTSMCSTMYDTESSSSLFKTKCGSEQETASAAGVPTTAATQAYSFCRCLH
jgi:hypothetical protein